MTNANFAGPRSAPSATLVHATAGDNARVWDGSSRGHYEVWYLTCNHVESRTGFWIRYTLEAPLAGHGEPYAQLWFAFFDHATPSKNFAINRRFPIAEHRAEALPFSVQIGTGPGVAALTHTSAVGALAGNGHDVRWDLSWLPATRTYRQLPELVYKTGFGDTKVLTPNLDVPVSGEIEIDGRKLHFVGEPGGQTHVWGRKHAHEWAWGHCNAFEGRRGAALETLSVKLKRRGVVLPTLTVLGLELDGERFRWGEFRHTAFTRGRFDSTRYVFSAISATARLEGEYTCRPADMTMAKYHDPDGEPSFCANTETADLRLKLQRRGLLGRFREAANLRAIGMGHFEIAKRTADPAISTHHVTVD